MFTIGCPQQVCASGTSTAHPSRRNSRTVARTASGNIASPMQVDITATRTSLTPPLGRSVPVTAP